MGFVFKKEIKTPHTAVGSCDKRFTGTNSEVNFNVLYCLQDHTMKQLYLFLGVALHIHTLLTITISSVLLLQGVNSGTSMGISLAKMFVEFSGDHSLALIWSATEWWKWGISKVWIRPYSSQVSVISDFNGNWIKPVDSVKCLKPIQVPVLI